MSVALSLRMIRFRMGKFRTNTCNQVEVENRRDKANIDVKLDFFLP